MKMRSESQSTLRLYSGSPTRSDKDTVSISSFYYKERVRHAHRGVSINMWFLLVEHNKGVTASANRDTGLGRNLKLMVARPELLGRDLSQCRGLRSALLQ